jgi:hypothetical protein
MFRILLTSIPIEVTKVAQSTIHKLIEFTLDMSSIHREEIIHSWDELFKKRELPVEHGLVTCAYQDQRVEAKQCMQCPWLIVDQEDGSATKIELAERQIITCQPPLIGDYSS